MTETYAPSRLWDHVSIAREFRGFCQAIWVVLATGERPDVTYGWRATTCIDRYDDLNLVGRVGVRTAPTFAGIAIAFFLAQVSLRAPSAPWEWLAVGYLGVMWLLVVVYDPLAGLARLAGVPTPGEEVAG